MDHEVTILGVNFADVSFDEALGLLGASSSGGRARTAFFANAATLNIAARDGGYRGVLNSADLVFGDGTGVRWAARLRGRRLKANLNGTDVIPAFIRKNPGIRVFLLGATEPVVGTAAARFARLFPDAVLAGWHHGYFDHERPARIITMINEARPDLVLVGFGNPLQERWISENREKLAAPLLAGIGGLFGFWAGTRRRAPSLVRRAGMEWLHILMSESGKTRRYLLGNPAFLIRMVLWWPRDFLLS
jgi:N-acetylglucosaminyldiphosphoundecaprenol N-acetyl-beta-D-mannosaminyltransferase